MSRKAIETLSHSGFLSELCFLDFNFCEHCMYGKQTRQLRNISFEKERQPLELVHSDVCGPMPMRSLGGSRYFVTFIDDATLKVWVYTIKSKDQTFACFQQFLSSVENQSGRKVKALRSDNGGEYISK